MSGGLLSRDKFTVLAEIMPEKERYSPFRMYGDISKNMKTTDPRYESRLGVISALKGIEEAYIKEVVVTPNIYESS